MWFVHQNQNQKRVEIDAITITVIATWIYLSDPSCYIIIFIMSLDSVLHHLSSSSPSLSSNETRYGLISSSSSSSYNSSVYILFCWLFVVAWALWFYPYWICLNSLRKPVSHLLSFLHTHSISSSSHSLFRVGKIAVQHGRCRNQSTQTMQPFMILLPP